MLDLATVATERAERVANALLPFLGADTPITRTMLNVAMQAAFVGTDAEGHWTQRDSFELLEFALVRHLRRNTGIAAQHGHPALVALAAATH